MRTFYALAFATCSGIALIMPSMAECYGYGCVSPYEQLQSDNERLQREIEQQRYEVHKMNSQQRLCTGLPELCF